MNLRTLACSMGLGLLAATAIGGSPYAIDWYTVDGGGEMFSSGGQFELGGTIGQHDANRRNPFGNGYLVIGGFWAVPPDFCAGDADGDGDIDFNDLDILLDQWGSPGPEADFDGNLRVDFGDLDILLDNWNQSCS